jgi:hypothetical protein
MELDFCPNFGANSYGLLLIFEEKIRKIKE